LAADDPDAADADDGTISLARRRCDERCRCREPDDDLELPWCGRADDGERPAALRARETSFSSVDSDRRRPTGRGSLPAAEAAAEAEAEAEAGALLARVAAGGEGDEGGFFCDVANWCRRTAMTPILAGSTSRLSALSGEPEERG
jgi:hypothetical protein